MTEINLPSDDRTIGSTTYQVTRLPMRQWLELKALGMRLAGPVIAEVLAGAKGGLSSLLDKNMDLGGIGQALYRLCADAKPADYNKLLDILGKCTAINNKPLDKDFWWPRNMEELAPYVAFALEVQFKDFFAGLVAMMPKAKKAKGDESQSQSQSQDSGSCSE